MPSTGSVIPILLPALANIRGAVGWMGLHQVPVTLKSWTWSGPNAGGGVHVPLPDLQIGHVFAGVPGVIQPPHVEGTAGDTAVTIDYLTPAFYDTDGVTQLGGFTIDQLNPLDQPAGFQRLYQLDWPQGRRFYDIAPTGVTSSRSMHYTLHLVSTDLKVPF